MGQFVVRNRHHNQPNTRNMKGLAVLVLGIGIAQAQLKFGGGSSSSSNSGSNSASTSSPSSSDSQDPSTDTRFISTGNELIDGGILGVGAGLLGGAVLGGALNGGNNNFNSNFNSPSNPCGRRCSYNDVSVEDFSLWFKLQEVGEVVNNTWVCGTCFIGNSWEKNSLLGVTCCNFMWILGCKSTIPKLEEV